VIALSVWISEMRFGYSKDPFANIRVVRSGIA